MIEVYGFSRVNKVARAKECVRRPRN